jgi:hypothetical protein
VLGAADLATAEGRAAAANAAVAVVAEHPEDLVRDQYLMTVAERTRIDVERLREALVRVGRGGRPTPVVVAPAANSGARAGADPVEVEALRAAVHFPALVADRLEPRLFADPSCVEVLDALLSTVTITEALDALSPEVRPLLQRIAVEEPHLDLETAPDHDGDGTGRPGGPADEARATLRRHRRTSIEHEHAEERYVSLSLTGLVEAATRRALNRLERSADTTSTKISPALDGLVQARLEGDWASANRLSEGLVDLLRALDDRSD